MTHSNVQVRKEAAEDFLTLLKEYEVERLIGIRWVGDSKTDPEEEDDDEEGADESKLPNTSKKEQPELATNKGLEFKVGSL